MKQIKIDQTEELMSNLQMIKVRGDGHMYFGPGTIVEVDDQGALAIRKPHGSPAVFQNCMFVRKGQEEGRS